MKTETYFQATEFENIRGILRNSAKVYKDNVAFVVKHKKENGDEYENITYKKLLEDINALGTKIYDMGYKGKRIAVIGRNRYEWILANFANLLGDIVTVPLDKDLQVDELENSLIRSKADAIVFDEKYIVNIEEVKNRNNTKLKEYICMSKYEGYKDVHTLKEEGYKLLEEGKREYIDEKIDNNKMSILLFTSGTTAKSKAVMLSQKNVASNVYAMLLVEELYPTDVNLAFLPFHHIFGSTGMIVMLGAGVKTAFPDGLRYIAKNLNEYQVSVFVGVPLLMEAIYKKIEQEVKKQGKTKTVKIGKFIGNTLYKLHIDIRRKLFKQIIDQLGGKLRLIISGGAPLDKKIAKGFNNFGIKAVQGYGLTETSPVIAAENYGVVKPGTIGVPMCNVEVDIVNKDENGIGELIAKGPNVMIGYYENEEATKEVIKDGWFHTGDLAYIDKEGYIHLTGRQKDMIVLKNGKKIFPEELETLVNDIEEVEECMVFGMPISNEENNVKLSVKVVYNKDVVNKLYGDISKDELERTIWEKIKKINKTLPKYKYIKNMILTDEELIKTTTKKVKRNEEMKKIKKQ